MIISISTQIRFIIVSIMAGMVTGVLFDFYRLIRGFKDLNKIVIFIEDTLFWVFAAIIVFIFLMYTNYAYMEMYVYVLLGIGVCLYLKFFSDLLIALHNRLFKVLGRAFRIFIYIIIYPFQYFIYSIKRKNKKNYKN